MPDTNKYPEGWDRNRVLDVIDFYERQTPEEEEAELEAAWARPGSTMMDVPTELVPAIRALVIAFERRATS